MADYHICTPESESDESIIFEAYACTLCTSQIEILSINTNESTITFKCLNNEKNHGIITMTINEYIKEMEKNIYSSFKCEICSQKENSHLDKNIFNYCINCKEIICNNCINKHKKEKDKNNHVFINAKELNIKCLEHNNEIFSYCQDCQKQLCAECLKNIFHFNHKKNILMEAKLSKTEKEAHDKIINILKEEEKNIENKQRDNFNKLYNILVDEKNQIENIYNSQIKKNNNNLNLELEKKREELNIKLEEIKLKYKKEEKKICEKYEKLNEEEKKLKNEKINLSQKKYEEKIEELKIKNNLYNIKNQITINEILKTSYEKYPNNYNNNVNIINIMASYYKNKNELFNKIFIDKNLISKLELKGKINDKIVINNNLMLKKKEEEENEKINKILFELDEIYGISGFLDDNENEELKKKIKELNYDRNAINRYIESLL